MRFYDVETPTTAANDSKDQARPSRPPHRAISGTLVLPVNTSVLFVDDDQATLRMYRHAFGADPSFGASFESDAEAALARLLSKDAPEIVVSDLVMPGSTGADLYTQAVLRDASWRQRFVFVTGMHTSDYVAEFLRGVSGRVLEKPVDLVRLRRAIRYAAAGAREVLQRGRVRRA